MGMRPLNFCPENLPFSGREAQILGGGQVIPADPRAPILPAAGVQGPLARRAPSGNRGT